MYRRRADVMKIYTVKVDYNHYSDINCQRCAVTADTADDVRLCNQCTSADGGCANVIVGTAFDPISGLWENVDAFSAIMEDDSGAKVTLQGEINLDMAALDGKLYVFVSGDVPNDTNHSVFDGNHVAVIKCLDPRTGLWTTIPLPKLDDSVKRTEYTPAMIDGNTSIEAMDGKLYVIGDTSNTGLYRTVATAICFDPATRLWSKLPPLKTSRYTIVKPEMAALDGKLYVVGGYCDEMPGRDTGSTLVDCFDPTVGDAGTWTRLPYMGTGRCHPGVAALDGMLYVVGGEPSEDRPDDSVECYDPSTNSWSYVASLDEDRQGVSLAAVGGKLYAIGGSETPYGSGKHVEMF
jgi:hypothetical protein